MVNDTNQKDLETALGLILKFRQTCPLSPECSGAVGNAHEISASTLINAKELFEKLEAEGNSDPAVRQFIAALHDTYIQCGNKVCGTCYNKYENFLSALLGKGLIEKSYKDNKAHYEVKVKEGEQNDMS